MRKLTGFTRRFWCTHGIALLSSLIVVIGNDALAQQYPSRVIKMVVPCAAGGNPDVIARLFAQHLSTSVGTVIIDNRPGANTTIGARLVATSEPDGYTLFFGSSTSLGIAPALHKNSGYDPVTSFTPVAPISTSPLVLAIGPSVPVKTINEFVAYAKANPGKLNFAAPQGGPPHLAGEIFKAATAIDIVPISYRAMSQAFTDVRGGQMDVVFDGAAALLPFVREGSLKVLVTLSPTRTPDLPDVPTMVESGLPDVQVTTWNGLVAPAGTPAPIIAKLNAAISDAQKSPDILQTLARLGSQPMIESRDDFGTRIASESKRWAEIVQKHAIKAAD